MFNPIEKMKNVPARTKLIMILAYPILPLGLLATFVVMVSWFEFSLKINSRELNDLLKLLPISLWFLGGPAGVTAIILVLLRKNSKLIFYLFLYGALSYTGITLMFIISGFVSLNGLAMLHAVYLIISLKIIIKKLYRVYREAF